MIIEPKSADHHTSSPWRRLRILGLVLLLVIAGVVVGIRALDRAVDDALRGGPGPDPTKLAALRSETMAAFTPPGGSLQSSFARDQETELGKPYRAKIARVFVFTDADRARVGRDAAVTAATADGWQLSRGQTADGGSVSGKKQLSTGEATLVIDEYTRDGTSRVSIEIEDRPCSVLVCN